jgi:hypothetical protein
MKCNCQSNTHGHKADKCDKPATEPNRMCKPCHDKAAKEMADAQPQPNQPPPRR